MLSTHLPVRCHGSAVVPEKAVGHRGHTRVCLLLLAMVSLGSPFGSAAESESRVIYMVIQAEPETTMREVKKKFELARDATRECNVREVLIEPIDPETFATLRSILQRGLDAVKDGDLRPKTETIRPMVGVDGAWTIDVGGPFDFIESVDLGVPTGPDQASDEAPTVTVTGPGPNRPGYSLRMHSPGRYVLEVPKEARPRWIKFDAVRDDGTAPVATRSVEQAWPAVGRAYLVTLSDVVGDEQRLFEALKDPNKVPNPIREIQDARKASLMVASFVEVLGNRLRIMDGRITFNFPKPQGVSPKRLWILFPLSEEQLKRQKEALQAVLAEEDGFMKLPDVIRRNQRIGPLTPEPEGAGWVELPLAEAGFTGVVDLNVDKWRQQVANVPQGVGDNALLVYEFESGDGEKSPVKMTEGYIVTERIAEWLPALRGLR
jgi:hypothetical protein